MRRTGRSPSPRGAAMIEMVLTLPLILFVLAVVFIFGRGYERVQQLLVAAGYEADRLALHAEGPAAGGGDGAMVTAVFPDPDVDLTAAVAWRRPNDADAIWLDAVVAYRGEAVDYLAEALDRLPDVVDVEVTATWPAWTALEDRLLGPTKLRHIRPANDWKHANRVVASGDPDGQDYAAPFVRFMTLIRETFLQRLDHALATGGGNPLADDLRTFYTRSEGYGGPELPRDWFTGFQ